MANDLSSYRYGRLASVDAVRLEGIEARVAKAKTGDMSAWSVSVSINDLEYLLSLAVELNSKM